MAGMRRVTTRDHIGKGDTPVKALVGKLATEHVRDRPIFVVGTGRSGTTAMLNALGCHPNVRSAGGHAPFVALVGGFAYAAAPRHPNWDTVRASSSAIQATLADLAFRTVFGDNYGINWVYKELRESGLLALRKTRWAARPYPTKDQYLGLCSLFPPLKFVYMIRNGLDVVHSRSRYAAFRASEFEEQCRVWAEHAQRYAYLLDAPNSVTVRQENMRDRPQDVMACVLDFVGLRADGRPAAYLSTTLVHPLDSPTQSGMDVRAEFGSRQEGHEAWTQEQKRVFKSLCGSGMDMLGYDVPF